MLLPVFIGLLYGSSARFKVHGVQLVKGIQGEVLEIKTRDAVASEMGHFSYNGIPENTCLSTTHLIKSFLYDGSSLEQVKKTQQNN